MAKSLSTIRTQVDETRLQLAAVKRAQPPVAQLTEKVRARLQELADEAQTRLIDRMADVISHNASLHDIVPAPAQAAYHAVGMAAMAIGVDNLVAQAAELAATRDNDVLRLTDAEKADRLDELSRRLYALELQEVELSADDLRPGINGAALLQIPLDVAIDAGLIGSAK